MTEDHIRRLVAVVKGFVDPNIMVGNTPTRIDMGCLRQDAVNLIAEIEAPVAPSRNP